MSAIDVIKGALAVAGSSLKRVNKNGRSMPIILPPTTTVNTIVRATTGIISGERQLATMVTPTAMLTP